VTTRTGLTTTTYQAPKRDWLLGLHGTEGGANPSATLDVSTFTAGTHYPNGYIPSGTCVSRLASGLWTFFDTTNGLEHGLTLGDVTVNAADLTQDAATGILKHGFVAYAKLPAGGRPIVATARTNMPGIDFADITP
jgi:hypothetical protein